MATVSVCWMSIAAKLLLMDTHGCEAFCRISAEHLLPRCWLEIGVGRYIKPLTSRRHSLCSRMPVLSRRRKVCVAKLEVESVDGCLQC